MHIRLILGVVCLAALVAGLMPPATAQVFLPPHVAAAINETARQARALGREGTSIAESPSAGYLGSNYDANARQRGESMMAAVVIGAIAENPALVGQIVAVAAAAAPEFSAGMARVVAQSFPGFATQISAAAGGGVFPPAVAAPSPPPTLFVTPAPALPAPQYAVPTPAPPAVPQTPEVAQEEVPELAALPEPDVVPPPTVAAEQAPELGALPEPDVVVPPGVARDDAPDLAALPEPDLAALPEPDVAMPASSVPATTVDRPSGTIGELPEYPDSAALAEAAAEAPSGPVVSLREAVFLAASQHPRVFGAKAAERVAVDSIDVERAAFLPAVDAVIDEGYVRTDNQGTRDRAGRDPGESGAVDTLRTQARVMLTQRVFDGFETTSRTRSAEFDAASAGHDVELAIDEIAIRAVEAYLDVLREREIVRLGEANVARHAEVLGKVTERYQSGVGNEVDVFQGDSRWALARTRLREQHSNLRVAEADYLEAVGEMPGSLEVPASPAEVIPATIDDGVRMAFKNNPELQSAAAALESRREDIEVAKAPNWPQLNVELSHRWERDADPTNLGPGQVTEALLRARWNLYRGGADKAREARAAERASQTMQRMAEIRRLLDERIRVSYNELLVARDQVPIIERRVKATEQVRNGYEEQFELGLRSLLDVLDVENELFSAKIALVEAKYRYRFAHYQLLNIAGMLTETLDVSLPAAPEEPAAVAPPE